MFGSSGSPPREGAIDESAVASPPTVTETADTLQADGTLPAVKASEDVNSGDIRKSQSPRRASQSQSVEGSGEKKRRSSGVSQKASSLLASAKNSLNFSPSPMSRDFMKGESGGTTPLQKLGKQDPALSVPQGQHNNSAGESTPGPRSTFRVGVWEDKNKKCRRTMEDTHSFLYNFLHTPAPVLKDASTPTTISEGSKKSTDELVPVKSVRKSSSGSSIAVPPTLGREEIIETDNGYFAIFDGHAGTFAADWCGKKLHIILEEMIRKNPNTPIPELLDQTFTSVDKQLEKLPLKNSGCTAVTAVLRWEDRIPNSQSATGSTAIAPATAAAVKAQNDEGAVPQVPDVNSADKPGAGAVPAIATTGLPPTMEDTHAKLKNSASRQRVLYTANVGDARIVLCRNGKALRLSYDHKGSDENEGKRVAAAGGLILNNRVNGVLAVTRALGDAYMKDLVTGHPYTTETVIQPDQDEFIILACDGVSKDCFAYGDLLMNTSSGMSAQTRTPLTLSATFRILSPPPKRLWIMPLRASARTISPA